LSGSGSDPDNDPVTYQWRDQGGAVVATTPSFSVSLGLGTYDYTFTVSDDRGGSASDSVHVVVRDTIAPSVTVTAPNGGDSHRRIRDHHLVDGRRQRGAGQLRRAVLGRTAAAATARCRMQRASVLRHLVRGSSPGPASAQARIRVIGRDASNTNGIGESAFTLRQSRDHSHLAQHQRELGRGLVRALTWDHNLGDGQNVKIEISRNGGSTWTAIIASDAEHRQLQLDRAQAETTHQRAHPRELDDDSDASTTQATSTSRSPPVSSPVTVPNTAVTGGSGRSRRSRGPTTSARAPNVKLEVSRNAGNNYSLILASLPNATETVR
jgi:hypothetical protein